MSAGSDGLDVIFTKLVLLIKSGLSMHTPEKVLELFLQVGVPFSQVGTPSLGQEKICPNLQSGIPELQNCTLSRHCPVYV